MGREADQENDERERGTGAAAVRRWHSLRVRIAAGVAVVAIGISPMIVVVVDNAAAVDGRERLRSQALDRLDAATAFYDGRGVLRFGAEVDSRQQPGEASAATRPDQQTS